MKKQIALVLIIVLLGSSLPVSAEISDIQVMPLVFISDDYFDRFIREYIDKPVGAITLADMEAMKEISELTISGSASNLDCSILPYFENLTSLTIQTPHRAMFDVTPIGELTYLTQLVLNTPHATGFSALAGLTNLTYLDLSGCYDITDISFLHDLKELVYLDLNLNSISDISALSELTKLEYLNLNAGVDNSFSAYFTHHIESIAALRDMVQLKELHLFGNQVNDLSPLENLTNLGVLDLGNNNIHDISALRNLVQLTWLNLGNCYSEQAQQQLQNDWWVDMKNRNSIEDISPLGGLANLAELNLENCEITGGLAPLASIKNLTLLPEDLIVPGSDAYTIGNVVITSMIAATLRTEDRTDSEPIGKAQPGEILKCVGVTDSGWYMVDIPDGQIAYVSSTMAELLVE